MRWAMGLLLLLPACSSPGPQDGPKEEPAKTVHGRTPDDDRKYKAAAAHGEVRYGMVKDEVRKAWGEPVRKERTTFHRKPATHWIWEYKDVYFDEEGFVVGFQVIGG